MGHSRARGLQSHSTSATLTQYACLYFFFFFFLSLVDKFDAYNTLVFGMVYCLCLVAGDSSYREDLRALAAGDLALAQSEKERLENAQRTDKKLRKAGGHGH